MQLFAWFPPSLLVLRKGVERILSFFVLLEGPGAASVAEGEVAHINKRFFQRPAAATAGEASLVEEGSAGFHC